MYKLGELPPPPVGGIWVDDDVAARERVHADEPLGYVADCDGFGKSSTMNGTCVSVIVPPTAGI